ncbi:hypothetical protein ANCDUO_21809, partial [Ancylostoma duodenale]
MSGTISTDQNKFAPENFKFIEVDRFNQGSGVDRPKPVGLKQTSVYCLQYDDEKIVSGLRDNTIK